MNAKPLTACLLFCFLGPLAHAEQGVKSANTNTEIEVWWKNRTDSPITVTWVDFDGNQSTSPFTLGVRDSTTLVSGVTYPGHFFRVNSAGNSFYCLMPYHSMKMYELHPFAESRGLNAQGASYQGNFYEGKYETLVVGSYFARGTGVAWKHTFKRRDTGQEGVEYLTEIERGPHSILLQNPVTRTEVKIKALGADESGRNAGRSDVLVRSNQQSPWQNNGSGQLIQVTY